jgi:hypothetical protein
MTAKIILNHLCLETTDMEVSGWVGQQAGCQEEENRVKQMLETRTWVCISSNCSRIDRPTSLLTKKSKWIFTRIWTSINQPRRLSLSWIGLSLTCPWRQKEKRIFTFTHIFGKSISKLSTTSLNKQKLKALRVEVLKKIKVKEQVAKRESVVREAMRSRRPPRLATQES